MKFCYEGVLVNYISNLEGIKKNKPIVFLHGWGGSTKSFQLFCDRLNKLGQNYIAIDFPPFGESSEPSRAWDVNDYAKVVLCILEDLNITKFNIVAHSFGARVAIQIVGKNMAHVNNLLITGGAGIKRKSIKRFLKVARYKVLKFLTKLKLYNITKLEKFGSDDYKILTPVMKKTFVNIVSYDQTKLLKNITIPTLLVWGDKDKETPFYFTKIFKKNIKNCEVIKFDGCSHFAYLERPNLFFKILCAFFEIEA